MKANWLIAIGLCLAIVAQAAPDEKRYDFAFHKMDLRKVIASLAQLQKKSVIFSSGVKADLVDLSLTGVTSTLALRLVLENYGYVAVDEGGVLHIISAAERGPASAPTSILTLHNVLAKDIEPNVKAMVAKDGVVSINDPLNALVITAPEETMNRVRALVDELDRQSRQVFIEAKLVETTTSFSRSLGLQWGPNLNNPVGPGVNVNAPGDSNTFVAEVDNIAGLNARLLAGEQNGVVKVLSNPKISTLNGVSANISSLESYTIRTVAGYVAGGVVPTATGGTTPIGVGTGVGTGVGVGSSSALYTNGLQQVQAGIELQVTPYIVSDEQVRLQILLSKSDPDFTQEVDGIPGISDNRANTSLVVHSGKTASIGGLIQRSSSKNQSGVPFLSTIPIIGKLFGSDQDTKSDQEILIFLTPTIYSSTSPVDSKTDDKILNGT